jgi:hypothetical protein
MLLSWVLACFDPWWPNLKFAMAVFEAFPIHSKYQRPTTDKINAYRNSTPKNSRNEDRELRRRWIFTSILYPLGVLITVLIEAYAVELHPRKLFNGTLLKAKTGALPKIGGNLIAVAGTGPF